MRKKGTIFSLNKTFVGLLHHFMLMVGTMIKENTGLFEVLDAKNRAQFENKLTITSDFNMKQLHVFLKCWCWRQRF
jgi:hypothetical protein